MPYLPVRVTRGACFCRRYRYTYALPRCKILQYRMTLMPLSSSLWNTLEDHVFSGVGLTGFFSSGPMIIYWSKRLTPCRRLLVFFTLLYIYGLVLCGWGLLTDSDSSTLSRLCIADIFNNINKIHLKEISLLYILQHDL